MGAVSLQAPIMHHSRRDTVASLSLFCNVSADNASCHALPGTFPLRQTVTIKPSRQPTSHQRWRDVRPVPMTTVSLLVAHDFLSLLSHTHSASCSGRLNRQFCVSIRRLLRFHAGVGFPVEPREVKRSRISTGNRPRASRPTEERL